MSRVNRTAPFILFSACTIVSSLLVFQLVLAGPQQQGAPQIQAGSVAVAPRKAIDVPINLSDIPAGQAALGPGVGTIELVITYDSTVIRLTSGDVSEGARNPSLFLANVVKGQINILAVWIAGSGEGDFLLATLGVTAIGALGTETALDLNIKTIVNADAGPIEGVVAVDGSVSIEPIGPPVAMGDTYSVDEAGTITVAPPGVLANDADPDGDPLTAALVTSVSNGTLGFNSDGSFIYQHDGGETTADSFTYTANDGGLDSTPATVAITIIPVNDVPVATGDAYNVGEDDVLTVALPGILANDEDPEGGPMTAVLVGSVSHGTLDLSPDGSFIYEHDGSETIADSFTYRAHDGALASNPAIVAITIVPLNDSPVATGDAYSVNEGNVLTTATPGVLTNDRDPDGDPLTAVLASNPANGTLSFNADGSFIYRHDGSETTADSFTYMANDGGLGSTPTTVAITIIPVNDVPVARGDAYSVPEGVALAMAPGGGVLANDTDPEGGPLTAVLVSGVSNGILSLSPDGSFTYEHDGSGTQADGFTYKANDGALDSTTVAVSITIVPGNDAPVAAGDAYGMDENNILTTGPPGVLSNDRDPNGDPLTATLVGSVANGTLSFNPDGSFIYTPNPNFSGQDSFTYLATDGVNAGNVATVIITVKKLQLPIEASIGPFSTQPKDKQQRIEVDGRFDILVAITTPATGSASSLQFSLNFDGDLLEFVPPVERAAGFSQSVSAFNGLESGRVNLALACGASHIGYLRVVVFTFKARGVSEETSTSISVENAQIFDVDGDRLSIDSGAPASGPVTVTILPSSGKSARPATETPRRSSA